MVLITYPRPLIAVRDVDRIDLTLRFSVFPFRQLNDGISSSVSIPDDRRPEQKTTPGRDDRDRESTRERLKYDGGYLLRARAPDDKSLRRGDVDEAALPRGCGAASAECVVLLYRGNRTRTPRCPYTRGA